MNKKKVLKTLLLIFALSASMVFGAIAAVTNQSISALLNRTIVVMYNKEAQVFKDAKGTQVYPISYNGTTYLPIRSISEMLDLPIEWDGATNTITLGNNEKLPTDLVKRAQSGATSTSWIVNDTDLLSFEGSTYDNAIAYKLWNGSASDGHSHRMYFNVSGYTTITFTAANAGTSPVEFRLYDQNQEVIATVPVEPGQTINKTIELTRNQTELAFAAVTEPGQTGFNAFIYDALIS